MGPIHMNQIQEDTLEKNDLLLEEPKRYKVIFVNDDITPMEFVIEILQKVFKHNRVASEVLTMAVHNDGSAVVGVYSFEIAEQRGIESTVLARSQGFPLQVKIERE
jgi:ATP-dependent Clp protease adaptor protein ClpS